MSAQNSPDEVLTPEQEALLKDVLTSFVDQSGEAAVRVTDRLLRHGVKIVTGRRLRIIGFEQRLFDRWGGAFDLYELSLYLAQQCGERFCTACRPQCKDFKFEALARLHAGACRVAGEILTLLKSGYPSGAHARWRTLHEIAVIALFISQESNEVAERYHNHKFVKSYEDAVDQRKFAARLKQEAISDEEFTQIEADYQRMLGRYGESFRAPFGWARAALTLRDPSFSGRIKIENIQEVITVDHWKPYYRMASHAVHPSATFLRFNLGMPPDSPIFLAGPSNAGLSEAGQGALLSLSLATAAFLTYDGHDESSILAHIEHRMEIMALNMALSEIALMACDQFTKVEAELEKEDRRLSKT